MNRLYTVINPLLSFALLLAWPLSAISGGGPSFDCAKAATEVELVICQPEGSEAQEADRKLAESYTQLSRTLPAKQLNWLRKSQRNWLRSRRQCIGDNNWRTLRCLRDIYRTRTAELEKGIVVNPVLADQLPHRVVLPNGLEGEFRLAARGSVKRLLFRRGSGEQLLWEGDSAGINWENPEDRKSSKLKGVSVVTRGGGPAVLAIEFDSIEPAILLGEEKARKFMALANGDRFIEQGMLVSTKGSRFAEIWVMRWDADDEGLLLKADEHPIIEGNWEAHLFPESRPRFYRFRFNGSPWQEVVPEPQQWLGTPDAAASYKALYRELMDGVTFHWEQASDEPGACPGDEINWRKAAVGLRQSLQLVLQAQEHGVAYADAAKIFRLLSAGEIPALTDDQRELLRGLDYLLRRIEAQEGGQQKLRELSFFPWAGESVYDYAQKMLEAFPDLEQSCLNRVDISDAYRIAAPEWFYTFWLRRWEDGTYDVAKRAIAHALAGTDG